MLGMTQEILLDRTASPLTQEVLRLALREQDALSAITDVAVALQCLRLQLDGYRMRSVSSGDAALSGA